MEPQTCQSNSDCKFCCSQNFCQTEDKCEAPITQSFAFIACLVFLVLSFIIFLIIYTNKKLKKPKQAPQTMTVRQETIETYQSVDKENLEEMKHKHKKKRKEEENITFPEINVLQMIHIGTEDEEG